MTPGSAVRLASVARHITDCATRPGLFSNITLVIRAGIHKMLVRIANREDPDQTASSGAV